VRAIRLLGKQPLDVIGDEQVLSIYLAGQAMDPDGPDVFAEPMGDLHRPEEAATRERQRARFAVARAERAPRDPAAARAELRAMVAAGMARAEALRGVRAAAEAAERADIAARLSYNARMNVEWLHKHQATCSRALFRTFEELRKVRRDGGDGLPMDESAPEPAGLGPDADAGPVPGPCGSPAAPMTPGADPSEHAHEQSDPDGSVAGVGWAKHTESQGFAPVGFIHPTAAEPTFVGRLEPDAQPSRQADVLGVRCPCEVVPPDEVPPMNSEPVAVEPGAGRDAPTVTNEASRPAASVTNEANAPTDGEPADSAPTATNEAISEHGAPTATNEAISDPGEVQRTATSIVFPEPPLIPLAIGVDRCGSGREDEPEPRAGGPVGCSLSTVTAGPCAPCIVIAGACASALGEHPTYHRRGCSHDSHESG
jgi:hypothetical protein